ncbi:MAG: dihydrolipoamide acetyltransferase family protein [Anaerolineales bacterium]
MAEIVNMPKLGFDMAEGTLVRWVIGEGQSVERGEVLAEIETDKATVEVEAQSSGVILEHIVEEGTAVPVGEAIAVMGEEGEEYDLEDLTGAPAKAEEAEEEAEPEGATEEEPAAEKEPAEKKAEPAEAGDGRYPGGVKASPVARRIAEEKGVDLQRLAGSGPGGRIVKVDVEQALEEGVPEPRAAPAYTPTGEPRETERIAVSRLRKAIGERMTTSRQQLPHFYVTVDLDAAPMMEMRRQANEALPEDVKLSVNDFIVKATALALREFPNLNASLEGDEIVRHGEINVGMAVAVENGLLTVVVKNADQKPLSVISQESRDMAERARAGKVKSEDVEGSTFTVSNLGMYDVDSFVAIINPPEAGILAIGSVQEVPVVEAGELTVGQRLKATLSADHRITDGAEAAEWLQAFRSMIEAPLRLAL